jgi:hypothetical protein
VIALLRLNSAYYAAGKMWLCRRVYMNIYFSRIGGRSMKTLYVILLIASCPALADISAIKRRYSDREMALRRPDLTAEMLANLAIVEPEPEIQIIETREQFIAHLESKLAQYKSLLQTGLTQL